MIGLNDLTTYYMVLQLYTLLTFKCISIYAVLSLDRRLPKDLLGIRFVDCNFLKPHYTSHIMKYISSLVVETSTYNSNIHYATLNNRKSYSVIISNFSLFLHINIIF